MEVNFLPYVRSPPVLYEAVDHSAATPQINVDSKLKRSEVLDKDEVFLYQRSFNKAVVLHENSSKNSEVLDKAELLHEHVSNNNSSNLCDKAIVQEDKDSNDPIDVKHLRRKTKPPLNEFRELECEELSFVRFFLTELTAYEKVDRPQFLSWTTLRLE